MFRATHLEFLSFPFAFVESFSMSRKKEVRFQVIIRKAGRKENKRETRPNLQTYWVLVQLDVFLLQSIIILLVTFVLCKSGVKHACQVPRFALKMFRCSFQNCTMKQYFSQPFPKPGRNVFTLLCKIDWRKSALI